MKKKIHFYLKIFEKDLLSKQKTFLKQIMSRILNSNAFQLCSHITAPCFSKPAVQVAGTVQVSCIFEGPCLKMCLGQSHSYCSCRYNHVHILSIRFDLIFVPKLRWVRLIFFVHEWHRSQGQFFVSIWGFFLDLVSYSLYF